MRPLPRSRSFDSLPTRRHSSSINNYYPTSNSKRRSLNFCTDCLKAASSIVQTANTDFNKQMAIPASPNDSLLKKSNLLRVSATYLTTKHINFSRQKDQTLNLDFYPACSKQKCPYARSQCQSSLQFRLDFIITLFY